MNKTKKTKIICTLGPATNELKIIKSLNKAGMNIARFNFSYDDFPRHQRRADIIRKINKTAKNKISILQDLSGPKIRIGEFKTEYVILKEGQIFTLTTDKIVGDETRVSVNYPLLPKEIKAGDMVLINDGTKRLQVLKVKGNNIVTKVLVGGKLGWKRGVNLPGVDISISSLTEKDRKDVEFGIKNKVDYVALSFVRQPHDVQELRDILNRAKSKVKIIAKVETPQAVRNIDEIIRLSDGIMVARGDLAMEIGPQRVPLIQKMIIKKCNQAGKFVITATQMLESMINSPLPTRAEVSDVANAILDGTDAVMLSEETTLGKFPLQAVEMMHSIITEVENHELFDAFSH